MEDATPVPIILTLICCAFVNFPQISHKIGSSVTNNGTKYLIFQI